MSSPFLNAKETDFLYKSKVFAGMMLKRAFVGPYLVAIGGNYRCNYRCVFCEWFSPMIREPRKEICSPQHHMNMDVYKRLVQELSQLGTKVVLVGDLEPFMDSQLIEKIKYAKHYDLGVIIITNGSLITEEKAEQLVNLKTDYLSVSVNAGTRETYPKMHVTETEETFDKIVSTVKLIEELKAKQQTIFPYTRLSMVVCNRNYQDLVKFVELCKETGVKNAHIKRLVSPSREIAKELELTPSQKEERNEYLADALNYAKKHDFNVDVEWANWIVSQKTPAKKLPCYYGWLFSMIDDNGNVYPCCFQDRITSCTMGNIKNDSFTTIWLSEKYQDFRRKHKNITERRKMGYHCNQPSCFFNNQQIYEILSKPYLLPFSHIM